MKTMSLLAGGVLLLSAVAVASPKSWNIALDSTAKAGDMTLPAGDYRVKLDNNQAVFRAANSDRTYNVPVKLATEPRKYDETKLELKLQGDTEVIEAIDLAGTATKLEFGE